jgi:hypothetical protein
MDEEELLRIISRSIEDSPSILLEGFETFELKSMIEELTGTTMFQYSQVTIQEEPFADYM